MDQQPANDSTLPRRVNAIFGDSKAENYYYKPQKITEEALMDVSISLHTFNRSFLLFFFRTIIKTHLLNFNLFSNWLNIF